MDNKLTMLLYRTPDSVRSVAQDTFAIIYKPNTNQIEERRFGSALPEPDSACAIYTVPAKTVEPAFAILDAITCTKPDPQRSLFAPGFCFSCQLRYISPLGLKKLLLELYQKHRKLPDCVDLESLYTFLLPQITAAARNAAAKFSGSRTLPYAYWWQDLISGTSFRDALEGELRMLFNSYGFRLETGSLKIMGLASIPVD